MLRLFIYIAFLAVPLAILGLMLVGLHVPKSAPGLSSGSPIGEGEAIAATVSAAPPSCALPNPPWHAAIHAVQVLRGGKKTPVQLDTTGNGGQVDVFVTDPDAPVILILVGGYSVVWNIRIHPQSRVAGIVMAGESSQIVVGVPGDVAATALTLAGEPCYQLLQRYFPPLGYRIDEAALRKFSQDALGRPLKTYQSARFGDEFWLGPELDLPKSAVDDMPFAIPSDLVDGHRPILFGRTALKRLVKEHTIRPAKPEDLDAWIKAGIGKDGIHADFSDLDLDRPTWSTRRSGCRLASPATPPAPSSSLRGARCPRAMSAKTWS